MDRPVTTRPPGGRRTPWILGAVTICYLVWSLGPLLNMVLFSFNKGFSSTQWEGFSLRWWVGRPAAQESMLYDPIIHQALRQSLLLASIATAVALPLGTTLALATRHWRSRVARALDVMLLVGLASPPLILAVAYWLLFAFPLRGFPFGRFGWFGTRAQAVALITWAMPLVVLIVRARLLGLDVEQEAMAADLGAPPTDVVRRVLAPQLVPAILASGVAVFAGAMGEFILTRALIGDVASAPLALSIGRENSPHDDAVATTLALAGSIAFVAVAFALRSTAKVHGWIRR